jgi:glycosyltransferase 2 family protein
LSNKSKNLLQILGSLLAFTGIFFVAIRFNEYAEKIRFAEIDLSVWGWMTLLSLIYCFSNLFLARGWFHLMDFLGSEIDWAWGVQAFGRSQLARYIPGNIFHLAGRQALGMANGLPGWVLAQSAVWEIGLIIVAAIPVCLFALPLYWPAFPVWLAVILTCLLEAGIIAFLWRWSPSLARAFIMQSAFLLVSALVFVGIIFLLDRSNALLAWFPMLGGSYILAWLVGLVTPGAPAGMGVRELVLLFLLSDQLSETVLLLAVILGRMVTVTGDLFFFILIVFIRRKNTFTKQSG